MMWFRKEGFDMKEIQPFANSKATYPPYTATQACLASHMMLAELQEMQQRQLRAEYAQAMIEEGRGAEALPWQE